MNFNLIRKIFLLLFMVIFLSCQQDKNPVTLSPSPVIDSLMLPAKWNTLSDIVYKVEVRVQDAQGFSDIDTVNFRIIDPNTTTLILSGDLYDDAAYYHADDGDVVAGDGVYSNRLTISQIVPSETNGEYTFEFAAIDKEGNHSQIQSRTVLFAPNFPPGIDEIAAPDTIVVVPASQIITISVHDHDGYDDIIRAYFESQSQRTGVRIYEADMFNDGNYELHGDEAAGDSVFSARLDSTFVLGKQGNYNLLFHVMDSFLEQNETTAVHEIFIGNSPPRIVNINLPETIVRPTASGVYKYGLITVQVQDAQGLGDIDSVYFYSRKPDSTMANGGQPLILVDNGIPFDPDNPSPYSGDLKKNDGIYSLSFFIYSDYAVGIFTFTFYVKDKAGNLSTPEVRTLEITD